jgi:hypothetical protein
MVDLGRKQVFAPHVGQCDFERLWLGRGQGQVISSRDRRRPAAERGCKPVMKSPTWNRL